MKKAEGDANKAMQQRLLEDVAAHLALATAWRMERRAAEKAEEVGRQRRGRAVNRPEGQQVV
jgi:hypothetical protein